ncbi:M28 family metallopeptidase [Longimicrobium sp.]|uniref:M28 family metallopeptidase n=1 Tax=Longimicrobium sp. TaxID=2029185 RepID=UPI002E2F14DE|nr:M28 family peptidase [Longimicrobium sp.]HEX6038686.1 M28 family peptidase [Longimicrobium sp.]
MKHTTRWAFALAAAAVAAPAAAQARPEGPLTHAARPTAAAISPEDLRTHLYILAADSMMGREVGTRGNVMATGYLAAQAQRIGLRPAGDNGTFFQTVPLIQLGLEPGATISAGGRTLALGTDFIPVPTYGSIFVFAPTFQAQNTPVVYGGRVGDPSRMISPEQARGKIVVFDAPMGPNGQPSFAFWAGGQTWDRYADAAGLAFATLDLTNEGIREFFQGERMELDHGEPETATPRVPPAFIVSQSAAAALFGRPMTGLQAGAQGGSASGAYAFFKRPAPFPSRNVVGIIPGSDASLRGEYVAIGAHNDHVGTGKGVDHDSLLVFNRILRPQGADQQPDAFTSQTQAAFAQALAARRANGPARLDSIFNGADDDGSGSAAMLEVAQYLMANRPKRSVIFVWHTAEEVGLYGSEWFTDHPTVPRESIVAQLNMDMIGRGGPADLANGGPQYLELVGSRRLSTQLGDLVEEVNRTGRFGFTFDYGNDAPGHPQQIYCRSDHANYARYGIPVTFFTTGGHSDYHQLTDEPQYIDYDKLASVSRFIAAVAQEIGNRSTRLVVDKPVAGPDAPCEQ